MMASLDPVYLYPLAINVAAGLLPIWGAHYVIKGRKKTGLKYPAIYWPEPIDEKDTDKYLFNCTQRAHQVVSLHIPLIIEFVGIAAHLFGSVQFCRFEFSSCRIWHWIGMDTR
jgi:hypothetical protein